MSQADQLIRQREALPLTSPRRREFNAAIYGLTHSELVREVLFWKAWEAEFAAAMRGSRSGPLTDATIVDLGVWRREP